MVVNRYDFFYRQASLHFQTASETQKPLYLSRMVDITDRFLALLGLETLKQKQDTYKRHSELTNELAKSEVLIDELLS